MENDPWFHDENDDLPTKLVNIVHFAKRLNGPYSYGHLSVISTYNPIYRMYNPIYNQL